MYQFIGCCHMKMWSTVNAITSRTTTIVIGTGTGTGTGSCANANSGLFYKAKVPVFAKIQACSSSGNSNRNRRGRVRLRSEGRELPFGDDNNGLLADDDLGCGGIGESLEEYRRQFHNDLCNHNNHTNNNVNNNNNNNNSVIGKNSPANTGGGPRWFCPLDCSPSPSSGYASKPLPLLLYLPGIDGTGLGLARHHHKLRQSFEVWCLHIPLMDRTPFSEQVKLVENTVRSEYELSPNRPIYLLGESVGGCLALAVAAKNPDIDLMLIVANPATSYDRSNLRLLKPLLAWMSRQCSREGEAMSMVKDAVLKRLPQTQVIEKIYEAFNTIMPCSSIVTDDTLSVSALLSKIELAMTASAYANSRLHAVKAPTLILSSGKDILLPSLEEGERLCRVLSNCDIRRFKDNGHFLFLEDNVDLIYTIKGACFYRRGKRPHCIADFIPPTPSEFRKGAEQYWYFSPATAPAMFSTMENGEIVNGLAGIPSDGPTLLVGYHMLAGLELIPLGTSLFEQKNIVVRGIAHPLLFTKFKDSRYLDFSIFDPFRVMGAVPVSSLNLYRLLASKSHVLLYPGGMREAFHRKGEFYQLFWPEEPEFVRMAARFGAKIVPFGVVGSDDIFELLADYHDLAKVSFINELMIAETRLGVKLRDNRRGEVANQPLHMPIMIPKVPGRLYYLFGKPIETAGRREELMDKQKAQEMYQHVKSEVERSLAYLKAKREHDPYRYILPRLLYQSTHGFTAQVPTFEL